MIPFVQMTQRMQARSRRTSRGRETGVVAVVRRGKAANGWFSGGPLVLSPQLNAERLSCEGDSSSVLDEQSMA